MAPVNGSVPASSSRRMLGLIVLLAALSGIAGWRIREYLRDVAPTALPPDVERFRADAERLARLKGAALPAPPEAAATADWPQWRGAARDGVSRQRISRAPWPGDGPRRVWSVPGGPGHSGLSIAAGRVFTMVQDGPDEVVLCLDASTGRTLWRHASPARFSEKSTGPGPHATPTVAEGFVYALGATGQLHCLEAATGSVVWKRDLQRELGVSVPTYGMSTSPLVDGDQVVVVQGPIAAFDRKDGRPLWKTGQDRPGHSSPVVAAPGGRRQLVAVTGQSLVGLAPGTGTPLWSFPWETQGGLNIATPIVAGNYVYVSSGYGKGCALVEIAPDPSGALNARAVYEHNRMRNTFSTSVLHQDHLYGFDDALLACMEFRTGRVLWKERGFGKGGVVLADDLLLVLGEEGRLALVDPSPDGYRELASAIVSKSRCWAPPSLALGRLYLRDQESIQCFELEPPGPAAGARDAAPIRVPWTTSRVVGTPDDPPPYRTEPAFPALRFEHPVDLAAVPGTNLMAVAELYGKIRVFENRPGADGTTVMFAGRGQLFGMTFHPRFAENGFLYIAFAPDESPSIELTRVEVRREAAPAAIVGSEQVVLRWPFGGTRSHNGGALRFGPDGCLYVGVGDGSPGMDAFETGQKLGDLLGSVLRIDVDRPTRGALYAVPRDNPFVDVPGARPEIWAFGLRQPWKMSFDPVRGDLWVGEIGQDLWESVLRVRRGDNYGWSAVEGGHPFRPGRPLGPRPLASPVAVHPHSELRAVIGGLVYRGSRFPELAGSYVYGDLETGRIWEVRLDGDKVVRHRELAVSPLRIIAFAEDAGRELYALNLAGGTIHRLETNSGATRNVEFPRRLSETGLFASVRDHRPAEGVVPYSVQAALWSDGAEKERFIALPGSSRIRPDCVPNLYVGLRGSESWDFPDGTVLVKTFSLGGQRVETRLLHLTRKADARDIHMQSWRGYSYRWNAEQTDADLVEASGTDQEWTVSDPEAPGRARRQTWHYPGRSECVQCHSMAAHFVLGVNTLQMNREIEAPGRGKINQLAWLHSLGLLETRPASPPARLVDYLDESQDLELRARSYLHANCAHCHVWLGGGNSEFHVHAVLPLQATGLVDKPPVHGNPGPTEARLLAPGRPEHSLIVHRMGLTGEGRMPPLSSSRVDERGKEILGRWIRQMPPVESKPSRSLLPVSLAGAAALAGIGAWMGIRRRKDRRPPRPV